MRDFEERYRLLVDNSPFAFGFHQEDKIVFVNKASLKLFGAKKPEELIGKPITNFMPSDLKESLINNKNKLLNGEKILYPREVKYLRLDGSIVEVEITAATFVYKGKPAVQIMAIDITEKKKIEKELKKAELEWEAIFNGIPNPIIIMDHNHNIINFNRMFRIKINKQGSEILKMKCWEIFHGEGTKNPPESCPFEKMLLSKRIETSDMEMEAFGGFFSVYCTPIYDDNGKLDKIIHIAIDIIDRKKAEDEIKALLQDKEILLKEAHHRILNTLNTVSNLLDIKSNEMNSKIVQAFHDMSNRVHTMGKVYRHLLESTDYTYISTKDYLSSLVDDIISFFPNSNNIAIEKDIKNISLDSKTLSTIGLITNEIVTNSFKYAFPGNAKGIIIIKFIPHNGIINLEITDNGIGISETDTGRKRPGLGMSLIKGMVKQIGGEMELKKENGTGYIFKIPNKLN